MRKTEKKMRRTETTVKADSLMPLRIGYFLNPCAPMLKPVCPFSLESMVKHRMRHGEFSLFLTLTYTEAMKGRNTFSL